jgi:hypothetical protein
MQGKWTKNQRMPEPKMNVAGTVGQILRNVLTAELLMPLS